MNKRKWIILLLSLIFISLIVLIKTNLIETFDTSFYNLVTYNMNDVLTKIYKGITFLGSTLFIVSLCIFFLVLFIILKKKNTGIIITSVLIISTIINNLIKIIIRRERPLVLRLVTEKSFSFPSGHTMAAVSMYGILIYLVLRSNLNKKLKIVLSICLGIIPILVSLSRVYLGAHFASDVIGAFILSTILLLVETYIIDKKHLL